MKQPAGASCTEILAHRHVLYFEYIAVLRATFGAIIACATRELQLLPLFKLFDLGELGLLFAPAFSLDTKKNVNTFKFGPSLEPFGIREAPVSKYSRLQGPT